MRSNIEKNLSIFRGRLRLKEFLKHLRVLLMRKRIRWRMRLAVKIRKIHRAQNNLSDFGSIELKNCLFVCVILLVYNIIIKAVRFHGTSN